jgi:hypothetical protein
VSSPDETAPEAGAPTTPRWFQRVLPVSGLLVALVVLAALVSPAFRDEVALSTSRQSQSYVELYFARSAAPNGQAVCAGQARSARVRFVIASHLGERQAVAFRVSLDPAAKGKRIHRRAGSVRVTPGAAFEVKKSFARPRGAYTVSVELPAFGQQLRAHCPGRRR